MRISPCLSGKRTFSARKVAISRRKSQRQAVFSRQIASYSNYRTFPRKFPSFRLKNRVFPRNSNVLGVFLNETSIFVTFNANSGSDSLVFAVNPLNFLENATFSRLSELGWFWILIESQYNEDFSPKSLKIHWIYREKYVFFQVDLSQKTLVFPAIGALFLNVGSSLVNSLCECVLDAVRAYSPVFPMDFADYKGIWKLSGSDLREFSLILWGFIGFMLDFYGVLWVFYWILLGFYGFL